MLLDRQDRSDKMIEDKKDGPGEVIYKEKVRQNLRVLRKNYHICRIYLLYVKYTIIN